MVQEMDAAEFERRRKEADELADAKTAKNRAKRQKKKDRSKGKGATDDTGVESQEASGQISGAPIKKRRLVSGKELLFRRPEECSEGEEGGDERDAEASNTQDDTVKDSNVSPGVAEAPKAVEEPRIMIHEDD